MTDARPATESLLDAQEVRWRAGDRVTVEHLLAADPTLHDHPAVVLDLIYGEVLLRRAAGEQPAADEYAARFPTLAAAVRDQFEVDAVLSGDDPPAATGPYTPVAGPPVPPGYEVFEELGRGGMGVVYRARQIHLDRIVALKMIRSGEFADPAERARFATEARAVARLSHPNIVQVYEVGEATGGPYLALEYVPGGTLAKALTGPVDPKSAAALVRTLARAVHHAHENGVVHRDLKPENVLLSGAELGVRGAESTVKDPGPGSGDFHSALHTPHPALLPKVTDFGLAKRLDETVGPTRTGDFLGTPNYAAPEQAFGRAVGPAVDVHALGGILYHLLAGRPPFAGATALETLDQVRFAEPVAPSRLRPNLPRDLETIALACLRKDPGKRYSSAAALADDLDRFLAGSPILARPVGVVERAVKWGRRRPAVAALSAAVVVLTVAAIVGLASLWQREAVARSGERSEREKAEARSAALLVANARLAWLADDFAGARASLADCPPALRGAEWAYLTRMTAPPVLEVEAGETVGRLAFSPDGTLVAAAMEGSGGARVWDVATGRATALAVRLRNCTGVTFTADGRLVLADTVPHPPSTSAAAATEVRGFDPRTGELQATWRHVDPEHRFVLAPGGRFAAVTGGADPSVRLLDGATGVVARNLGPRARLGSFVAFAPGGAWVATHGHGLAVRVFDPATGAEVRRRLVPERELRLVPRGLQPDGLGAVFDQSGAGATAALRVARLAAPGADLDLPVNGWLPTEFAYTPDGKQFAMRGPTDRTVVVRDSATGAERWTLRGHRERVTAFEFGPGGRRLAVACWGGQVLIWDVQPPAAAAPEG